MIFNPLSNQFKSITGAIPTDCALKLRVKNIFDSVVLLVRKDGENSPKRFLMNNNDGFFEVEITLNKGLYFYCFDLGNGKFIGQGENFEGEITSNPTEYQLTVYDKNFKTPDWLKGGIIYQIFPDRFYSSKENFIPQKGKVLREDWGETPTFLPNAQGEVLNNDFFGGDIKGIIQKLDYLASLKINCIYLNPIFKAYSNHRYDTGDYLSIDPLLGNIEDLKELIKRAGEYGIKIILDGVFNHTGSDSLYFNKNGNYSQLGAFQSKDSKYYSWFNFIKYPNEYHSWWGIKTLPSTNKDKGGYREFITGKDGVIEHYTKLGIGGWRLDVVDEIPADFVKDINSSAKNVNPDAVIIGEVWEDASNKISYGVRREYFQGNELDSVMNYPLKNAIIDYVKSGNTENLIKVINTQIDHYPKCALHSLMNILSTHDTFRLISAVCDLNVNGKSKLEMSKLKLYGPELNEAKNRVKIASLLQYTLYGVPSVYYGDEISMQGFVDPLNRVCFNWQDMDSDMLSWYKKLGEIRSKYTCFKEGDLEFVYASDGVIIFKRIGQEEVMTAINLSNTTFYLDFDGELINLLTQKIYKNHLQLNSKEIGLFTLNK